MITGPWHANCSFGSSITILGLACQVFVYCAYCFGFNHSDYSGYGPTAAIQDSERPAISMLEDVPAVQQRQGHHACSLTEQQLEISGMYIALFCIGIQAKR
jgi:hypothetical protein